jgi:hypothetical protein
MREYLDSTGRPVPTPVLTPKVHLRHDNGQEVLVPQDTYFFKKSKGQYIAVDREGAWRIYSNQNQMIGSKLTAKQMERWEYVGRTNGQDFVKKVRVAHKFIEEGNLPAFHEAVKKAELEEFKKAKKDTTPPPNRDIINSSGLPDNQITG